MKQVLSVADFALILNMVNERINNMEHAAIYNYISYNMDHETYEETKKNKLEELKQNSYYQSLSHLKNSLENLNIEVECPDITLKE